MFDEGHDNMANMSGNMPGMSSNMPGTGGDLRNTTQMSMHSNFYWSKNAIILFANWPNHDFGMYLLAFLFVFLLATAAEVLSVSPIIRAGTSPIKAGAVQAGTYAFRIGFAYLVMLSVMSFNIGIFIAAVTGHSLGFFLIKARAQALVNQADPKVIIFLWPIHIGQQTDDEDLTRGSELGCYPRAQLCIAKSRRTSAVQEASFKKQSGQFNHHATTSCMTPTILTTKHLIMIPANFQTLY